MCLRLIFYDITVNGWLKDIRIFVLTENVHFHSFIVIRKGIMDLTIKITYFLKEINEKNIWNFSLASMFYFCKSFIKFDLLILYLFTQNNILCNNSIKDKYNEFKFCTHRKL